NNREPDTRRRGARLGSLSRSDDLDRLPEPAFDVASATHQAVPVLDPVLWRLLRELAMPFGDPGIAGRAQHRRLPQLLPPVMAERRIPDATALAALEIRHCR